MSLARSNNAQLRFERSTSDQFLAVPTRRPNLERSHSSPGVTTQNNMASTSSRSQSSSPTPSRSFFFRSSKREKSSSPTRTPLKISAPVLISSTNPLVVVKTQEEEQRPSLDATSRASVQISEILAAYTDSDDDDDEEEEVEETDEEFHTTRLSPTPPLTNRPVPLVQLQYQQPGSRFSEWTISTEGEPSSLTEDMFSRRGSVASTASASTSSDASSMFSRRESLASIYTEATSTELDESFQYNPYVSKVVSRGFQESNEVVIENISRASLKACALRMKELEEWMESI